MTEELEPRDESTAELVREAFAEVRELTKLEIALAKDEALQEVKALRGVSIAVGTATVCAIWGIVLVITAIALGTGSWVLALVMALVFLAVAGAAAFFALRRVPRKALPGTQKRMADDLQRLKERIA